MGKIRLDEIAEKLNLSTDGADAYLALLVHGELTLKDLSKLLGKRGAKVKKAIEELGEKEMIFKLKNADEKEVYQVLTPLQLEERLDRQKKVIGNLKSFVIPQVQPAQRLSIVKYEGLEGIRKVYVEILEEAVNKGEDILAFESEEQGQLLGEDFLRNYSEQRIKAGVMAYVIGPDTKLDRAYKKRVDGRYTHVKLLKNFGLEANINVVGDLVMSFSVKPAQGTIRRNAAEANSLKEIFKMLWKVA